jgi:hypothetical protein
MIPTDKLVDTYHEVAVFVCNSVNGFETGPLPVIEALACGVPVLTRSVGVIPDIFNGRNMLVRAGAVEDMNDLENELRDLMENPERRNKLRQYGWETAKRRDAHKMARMYYRLYTKTISDKPLVSVIMPICNPKESITEVLAAALNQDYSNYEIVVADSSEQPYESLFRKVRDTVKIPIKYMRIKRNGDYTLAKARNEAIIAADGKMLVFCDDRLAMEENAVRTFASGLAPKMWLWGTKDHYEKGFVENFSAVGRQELIDIGMFCERINEYGGMTQEIRTRAEKNSFAFQRAVCNAKVVAKSSHKDNKRQQIVHMKTRCWEMYGDKNEEDD